MAKGADKTLLAARYAEAMLNAAADAGATAAIAQNVTTLSTAIAADAEFTTLFNNPTIDRAALATSLQQWGQAKGFDTLFGNLLAVLTTEGRLPLLPAILTEFTAQQKRRDNVRAAHVTAATEISNHQRLEIQRELEAKYHTKIEITTATDASLLGGITIQIDSTLIDASLSGKLARLERDLKHAA